MFRGRNAENDTGSCVPHEFELQLPEKFWSSLDHASSVPSRRMRDKLRKQAMGVTNWTHLGCARTSHDETDTCQLTQITHARRFPAPASWPHARRPPNPYDNVDTRDTVHPRTPSHSRPDPTRPIHTVRKWALWPF